MLLPSQPDPSSLCNPDGDDDNHRDHYHAMHTVYVCCRKYNEQAIVIACGLCVAGGVRHVFLCCLCCNMMKCNGIVCGLVCCRRYKEWGHWP